MTLAASPSEPSAATEQPCEGFPGVFRGELEHTWTIHDRGTAYVSTTRSKLSLTLETGVGGLAILVAKGRSESNGVFLAPGSSGAPTRTGPSEVDHLWAGRWLCRGDTRVLRLERGVDLRGSPMPELRCARVTEPVGDAPQALLRCEPGAPFRGLPWNDPVPAYLRTPLSLAESGSVHATVSGSADEQPMVALRPAASPPSAPAPGARW